MALARDLVFKLPLSQSMATRNFATDEAEPHLKQYNSETIARGLINLSASHQRTNHPPCPPSTTSNRNPQPPASSTPPPAISPSSSGRNKYPSHVVTFYNTASMATTITPFFTVSCLGSFYKVVIRRVREMEERAFMMEAHTLRRESWEEYGLWKIGRG